MAVELSRIQFERAVASAKTALPPWNLAELADLIDTTNLREAAVLIGLIERPNGWRVLLTQRTETMSSHAGQVSFPGGRIDPDDQDAIAAALRETFEEVGIPAQHIQVLGTLDRFATISNFSVTPVLAILASHINPTAQEAEVAEIFEAPLALFCDPNARQVETRLWRGAMRSTQVYHYEGKKIWGATASMLVRLVDGFG